MVPIEDNMKSEEIGLPKSTLWNFIKDELTQNKVKADRNIWRCTQVVEGSGFEIR